MLKKYQDIRKELAGRGEACSCIRCREVKGQEIDVSILELDDQVYTCNGCEEHFLSYNTPEDRLAGFLRLSLPGPERRGCALEQRASRD